MFSFLISLAALILGYVLYGRFVERTFGPDPSRPTPAVSKADGVDYVPMPSWKVYMIQFLNIAGTGPIFGAIMGAKFGPSCYLWIVFGCIFAGAVHDYMSGMLSVRGGGAGLPEIIRKYLGKGTATVMLVFSILLMVMVGAVFVYSPAIILGGMTGGGMMIWVAVIFVYYLLATLVPIDKIIGRFYPIFAFALIFMAVALAVCLLIKWPAIPEIWDGLGNMGEASGLLSGQSIFPCLFITVACGAISGFHATQSPMMARCIKNEKLGRPIFYGAMITEGVIALIWAAVSSYFFYAGGATEVGSDLSAQAPTVVTAVSRSWLGVLGGILAILGVVAAPITSGDTAFRSARLMIADTLHVEQNNYGKRLAIAVPLFAAGALVLWFNIADENGFNIIWRYFGWSNQTLACFTLWAITSYLTTEKKGAWYLITLLPAAFMTAVCVTYICVEKIGLNLPAAWIPYIATTVFAAGICLYYLLRRKKLKKAI